MTQTLRIAVTGGSGNAGRWVVRGLLDRGHAVVNVDREPSRDNRGRFVRADIRDRAAIEAVLRDCDAVCHLADIPNSASPFPSDEIYWSNARSASVVLQAAADLHLRHAVYASSAQVYGLWGQQHVAPTRLPIDENYPINPRNVYAVSKAANELFAQNLSRESNLGISILRFPWVLATEEDERRCLHDLSADGPVDEGLATFIHGSDLGLAFAAAIETSRAGCEIYNLSAADVVSKLPLRDRIERHHRDFPRLPPDWPDYKSPLLIEKAEKLLNWRPQWSFRGHLLATETRG